MKQYKIVPSKCDDTGYSIYEKSFIFFWKKVGRINTYQSKLSVVEQACLFVHSQRILYFEA